MKKNRKDGSIKNAIINEQRNKNVLFFLLFYFFLMIFNRLLITLFQNSQRLFPVKNNLISLIIHQLVRFFLLKFYLILLFIIGPEWNTYTGFSKLTKPNVIIFLSISLFLFKFIKIKTKRGEIIEPIQFKNFKK